MKTLMFFAVILQFFSVVEASQLPENSNRMLSLHFKYGRVSINVQSVEGGGLDIDLEFPKGSQIISDMNDGANIKEDCGISGDKSKVSSGPINADRSGKKKRRLKRIVLSSSGSDNEYVGGLKRKRESDLSPSGTNMDKMYGHFAKFSHSYAESERNFKCVCSALSKLLNDDVLPNKFSAEKLLAVYQEQYGSGVFEGAQLSDQTRLIYTKRVLDWLSKGKKPLIVKTRKNKKIPYKHSLIEENLHHFLDNKIRKKR